MHLVIEEFNIRYGERSLNNARSAREEEWDILERSLKIIENDLKKISRSRKPFVYIHLSEGATATSVYDVWSRRIEEKVYAHGGSLVYIINTGIGIGNIKEEEFELRMDVLRRVLNDSKTSKILFNNVIRRHPGKSAQVRGETGLVFDNRQFDYYYMIVAYALDRCAIGQPLEDEIENIMTPGSIYAVTTPVQIHDYMDFKKNHEKDISFMFMGDLGTGYPAPFLVDAVQRVDGVVLVGHSIEHTRSIANAFKANMPGRLYALYALRPVKESSRLIHRVQHRVLRIPMVAEEMPRKTWVKESGIILFMARITPDEAEEAIIKARDFYKKKLSRSEHN